MHIELDWPKVIDDFRRFLADAGLQYQGRKDEAIFSNKELLYSGEHVNVRIVSDHGIWFVEIADASHQPDEWYDAAILRDILLGNGQDVLSLQTQIEIIEAHWEAITNLFAPGMEGYTHSRLALLREERAKRRFPNLDFQASHNGE